MTERRKKLIYLLALLGGRTRRRGVGYDYLARILGAITMCIATGLYAAFEALIRYRFPSEGWGLTLIFVPIGVFYIFFFERLFLERILRAVRLTKKQSLVRLVIYRTALGFRRPFPLPNDEVARPRHVAVGTHSVATGNPTYSDRKT